MPDFQNLEYLNFNSLRAYPMRELLSRMDKTVQIEIPDDFIVESSIAASSNAGTRLYVSRLFNKLSSVVVEISDFDDVVVGTFTIGSNTFVKLNTYPMVTAAGAYLTATGRMTIGTLDSLKRLPAGTYEFDKTSTELEPKTVIPSVQGVNSITFVDGNGITQTLTGHVKILARTNLRYSYDNINNTVTIDAGDGLGLNVDCDIPVCVKMINGVRPNPVDGNISLIALDCANFTSPSSGTLTFQDNCCTPCAGCDDLATLTDKTNSLENMLIDIQNAQGYLFNQFNSFRNTVNSNCACP